MAWEWESSQMSCLACLGEGRFHWRICLFGTCKLLRCTPGKLPWRIQADSPRYNRVLITGSVVVDTDFDHWPFTILPIANHSISRKNTENLPAAICWSDTHIPVLISLRLLLESISNAWTPRFNQLTLAVSVIIPESSILLPFYVRVHFLPFCFGFHSIHHQPSSHRLMVAYLLHTELKLSGFCFVVFSTRESKVCISLPPLPVEIRVRKAAFLLFLCALEPFPCAIMKIKRSLALFSECL